jgi:hypothetical protein
MLRIARMAIAWHGRWRSTLRTLAFKWIRVLHRFFTCGRSQGVSWADRFPSCARLGLIRRPYGALFAGVWMTRSPMKAVLCYAQLR